MSVYGGPADWWTDGTDAGRTHIATKGIAQSGLVLNLDAGVSSSYSGSGATWTDLSGNGRNATVVGSPTFTNGYFDSTNDSNYFTMASYSHRTSDFTYSMWVTIDTVDSLSTLFENGSWTDTLLFRHETNQITVYAEGTFYGAFSFTPVAGAWYNIVFKRESSVAYAYANGSQIGSTFALSVDINLANQNMFLMRSQHTTSQNNDGKIATFAVYSRALSLQDIQQNFNALRGRFGV
jgi:hypothetical protein